VIPQQDSLALLTGYDGIFYDTYGEFYSDMQDFHAELPRILKPGGVYSFFNGCESLTLFPPLFIKPPRLQVRVVTHSPFPAALMQAGARQPLLRSESLTTHPFPRSCRLAPDNIFFAGVACQVIQLELQALGLGCEFQECEIKLSGKEWEADSIARKYWHRDSYHIPICRRPAIDAAAAAEAPAAEGEAALEGEGSTQGEGTGEGGAGAGAGAGEKRGPPEGPAGGAAAKAKH
jgi:hypothetical protein